MPLLREQDASPEREKGRGWQQYLHLLQIHLLASFLGGGLFLMGSTQRPEMSKCSFTNSCISANSVEENCEGMGTGESLGVASLRSHSTTRATSNNTGALKWFRREEDSLSHLGVQKWCYSFPSGFQSAFRQEPFLCLASVKD